MHDVPNSWTLVGISVIALFAYGWVHATTRADQTRWVFSPWVCGSLVVYTAALMVFDPLMDVYSYEDVMKAVGLLMPFILSAIYLARSDNWSAVIGSVLFILTALAMLVSNANLGPGAGFFTVRR